MSDEPSLFIYFHLMNKAAGQIKDQGITNSEKFGTGYRKLKFRKIDPVPFRIFNIGGHPHSIALLV